MKKLFTTTIVILAVGLAMVLVGGILQGINWGVGFDGTALATALTSIGYIASMLSGVVLTGAGVAYAVKGDCKPKDDDKDKE